MSDPAFDAEPLDAEDAKLVTLARASRARSGAFEGAAVRDETGRTYTAATVSLPSLSLSALRTAVAMAVSSGAATLAAAAVVREDDGHPLPEADVAAVRDLGGPWTPVFLASPGGAVISTTQA
jgi:cytidine deaminase